MRRILAATVLVMAFAGGAALAAPSLLGQDQFDFRLILPPPPAAGSPAALAEIAELKAIAAARTKPEWDAAANDAEDEGPDIFNAALGFDATKLPVLRRLLETVADEEDRDTKVAKDYFRRPRPWVANPQIASCENRVPGKSLTSYPSGHSSLGFAMGVVLATLVPEKSQAILARASQYAAHRLVCGVHFRSDIVAGQQFGTVLALRLMENSVFHTQMMAAQMELRGAHPTN